MPESFPSVSVSNLAREVNEHIDGALAKIAELEQYMKSELERIRTATDATPSPQPPAPVVAEPEQNAPEPPAPEPVADAVPTEPANAAEVATPESVPPPAPEAPAA